MEESNNAAAMRYVNFKVFRFILELLKLCLNDLSSNEETVDGKFVFETADKILP